MNTDNNTSEQLHQRIQTLELHMHALVVVIDNLKNNIKIMDEAIKVNQEYVILSSKLLKQSLSSKLLKQSWFSKLFNAN